MQKKVYGCFSIISPILFLFYPHSAQLKDTSLRFLALNHTYEPLIGFEERFHQNNMQMSPFTCSYFYSSYLFLCIISPQHRLLIEPNTNKNTKLAMVCSHWCNNNQNNNYQSLQAPDSTHSTTTSTKPTNPLFIALELLLLYSHAVSYSSSPLNACSIPGHPLLSVDLFHIMHK